MTNQNELEGERSEILYKIDYIVQELTSHPDVPAIALFYDILQRKNSDLIEQLRKFLDNAESSKETELIFTKPVKGP